MHHSRTKKIMYALFFYAKGPITQIPVPENTSVMGNFYALKVLPEVVQHYKTLCPCIGKCGIRLLHDNAPEPKFTVVKDYLDSCGIKSFATSCLQPRLFSMRFFAESCNQSKPLG